MADEFPSDFTSILAMAAGDSPKAAAVALDALKNLARQRIGGERAGHTLTSTALVNELYARLFLKTGPWNDRSHFFRAAAEAMRNILVDYARSRGRAKRGGGRMRTDLDVIDVVDMATRADPDLILTFDEAISRLKEESPEAGEVVRLKFYGGLTNEETGEALDLSLKTVKRRWAFARAFLARLLNDVDDRR